VRLIALATLVTALELPPHPLGAVSDFAGALSADARARVDARLRSYDRDGRRYAVGIFPSADGMDPAGLGYQLATRWSIGGPRNPDGVLLLLFLDEHAAQFQIGYGLDEHLPDRERRRLLRDQVEPRLLRGDVEGAITAGLDGAHRLLGDDFEPPLAARPVAAPRWFYPLLVLLFAVALVHRRRLTGWGGDRPGSW
jgi:uncharacterized protein